MSYTAPAYYAANLTFGSGYTAPAYDAADLAFGSGDPIAVIQTGTTLTFYGKVDKVSDFSVSTASVVSMENPYRAFTIPTSTDAAFVTWQRHIDIQAGSAFSFRSGSKFIEVSNSTVSLQVWATLQSEATIASETALSVATRSFTLRPFSSSANTTTEFKGGRNYDTAIIARGKTTLDFASRNIVNSSYSGAADTAMSMIGSAVSISDAALQTASIAAFYSLTGRASSATIDGSSSGVFYGHPARQSEVSFQGLSSAAFVSSYTFSIVNPIPTGADFAFVKTGANSVYVLQ